MNAYDLSLMVTYTMLSTCSDFKFEVEKAQVIRRMQSHWCRLMMLLDKVWHCRDTVAEAYLQPNQAGGANHTATFASATCLLVSRQIGNAIVAVSSAGQ